MEFRCYSRRILSPFRGMLQVMAVEGGEAESADGVTWTLYVMSDRIVTHTGLGELRYGTWTRRAGRSRSRVRGTARDHWIEETGDRLVEALERWADQAPFKALDRHECWLLDRAGRPLALLESVLDHATRGIVEGPRWHPGAAAQASFSSAAGDAARLADLFNSAAGRRSAGLWVERDEAGNGRLDLGERIPAVEFPPLLVREDWDRSTDRALVQDFLVWQAPWLLQLHGLDPATRKRLERAAWRRPLETSRLFRLFPVLLDPEGLRVTRVKAGLMQSGMPARALEQPEPFLPVYVE